ncbi:MAG: hypothetical protein M1438_17060 [Deltaproteobacteria bacterium]|nr:hypothetical protein [Deltaproteobacteria bacterium]
MKKLITPAFLMMVVILVLAEGIARIFFAQDISGRFAYGYDPQAGFLECRDGTVKLVRAGGRRFHPQTFQRQRPPDTYRIMVIGDSVPRGPSFKQAYPWLLGADLRRRQVQAESLNMALPGYGARRCQVVLEKALEFMPSLIILHINDTNKWEDDREWRRSQEFKGWHPQHWLMKVFIFRRLYEAKQEKLFWPLVPDEIRLKGAVSDADAQVVAGKDPVEIAARIRLAREKLAENVAMVRACHIPLLLISQCRLEKEEGRPPYLVDHGLDSVCAAFHGPGVFHLTMREVFQRPDFASYFSDSGHLKPAGHELLAQAICRKILSEQTRFGLPGVKVAAGTSAPPSQAGMPDR